MVHCVHYGIALIAAGVLATGIPSAASAGPTLVFEPATSLVLSAEEPDRPWHPASVTKLMTAYLTFDAVKRQKLTWTQSLPLSAHARAQPATRIGLKAGIPLNVDQGVRGLIMRSANDFAVALAEAVSGSEEAFIVDMNAAAKRLGMTRTVFKNPHGLPDPEQATTARDLALLVAAIHKEFPEHLAIFSSPSVTIGRGVFFSQNDLVRSFTGGDGMKTGFTCSSGYNVVASATRGGHKLVAVVLGEANRQVRSQHAAALLTAGFEKIEGRAVKLPAGVDALVPEGKPVTLADLAMTPAETLPVFDMSRLTRTSKCGNSNREPGKPLRRATVQTAKLKKILKGGARTAAKE